MWNYCVSHLSLTVLLTQLVQQTGNYGDKDAWCLLISPSHLMHHVPLYSTVIQNPYSDTAFAMIWEQG